MAAVGIRNGKLGFFPSSTAVAATKEHKTAQVIQGGLRATCLPLGRKVFQRANIQQHDPIILLVDNDKTSVACILAAMEMQCYCVLLSKSRMQLLSYVQNQTGIDKVAYVNDAEAAIHVSTPSTTHQPQWLQASEFASNGCICLLTSGSVGNPKVVACTWSSMVLQGECTYQGLFPTQPARITCATSIGHAYSINAIFTLFTSPFDASSELCFAKTTEALYDLLQTKTTMKRRLLYATRATYTALLAMPSTQLHVDIPFCAGSRMDYELLDQAEEHLGLQLMQNYGTSETGDITAWGLWNQAFGDEKAKIDVTRSEMYVGMAWPGVQIEMDTPSKEVLVKTPWQSVGYVRNQAFESHQGAFHRTADTGRVVSIENATALWLGDRIRPSMQIRVREKEVVELRPSTVEQAFLSHAAVSDALMLLSTSASLSATVVRVRIVLHDDAEPVSETALAQWGAEKLMIPSSSCSFAVELVPFLPCSPAGKLMYC